MLRNLCIISASSFEGDAHECHVLTLVPFLCLCFSLVRAWVGVGILSFCSMFSISMCLAWYGSQSEAAGNRCLWLRTILRQPVFPLWVVGCCFLCFHHTGLFCFSFTLFVILFSVSVLINITWTFTTLRIGPIHPIPHQKRKRTVTSGEVKYLPCLDLISGVISGIWVMSQTVYRVQSSPTCWEGLETGLHASMCIKEPDNDWVLSHEMSSLREVSRNESFKGVSQHYQLLLGGNKCQSNSHIYNFIIE